MDVEKSSLCNCVVNFLLEENYILSAFELLHELLDDGRHDQAIRLKEFFADPVQFPPDQISRFNTLRVADPQSLLEEKEALEEKLAIRDYENRLAQEDILKFKTELQKKSEARLDESSDAKAENGSDVQKSRETTVSDLGSLKAKERLDLNCAVKEYLLLAGYRLTAMTFYEEFSGFYFSLHATVTFNKLIGAENYSRWETSLMCNELIESDRGMKGKVKDPIFEKGAAMNNHQAQY
ncbi:armadillo-like helical domain-containing protein [Tanacetum coccineum]